MSGPPVFTKHPRSQSPVVNLAAFLNKTRVPDDTRARVFSESSESDESVLIERFHYVPVQAAAEALARNQEEECARDLLRQSQESEK